jgi:hypothetical protein
MGRAGEMMIPFLKHGSEELKQNAEEIRALGGAYNDTDALMGQQVAELETKWEASINGIEKAAAKPILQALIDNSEVLTQDMADLSQYIAQTLPAAMKEVGPELRAFAGDIKVIMDAMHGTDHGELLKDLHDTAADKGVRSLYDLVSPDTVPPTTFFEDVFKDVVKGHLFVSESLDPEHQREMLGLRPESGGYGTREMMVPPQHGRDQSRGTAVNYTVNVALDPAKIAAEFKKQITPHITKLKSDMRLQANLTGHL